MTKVYNRRELKTFRKNLRNSPTKSEKKLWFRLRGDQLEYRFRRQHAIGNYIADFYCPKLKIAIELDGLTHLDERQYEKDVIKQKYLEEQGISVIRFWDQELTEDIEQVVGKIYYFCKQKERELGESGNSP